MHPHATHRQDTTRPRRRGCPDRWRICLVVAAVALALPGCGRPKRDRAVVTGKVIYNGNPLRFGTVILEPETGQYATGAIQPDGTFRMRTRGEGDGVPVGKCKVRFVCFANQDPSAKPASNSSGAPRGEGLDLGPSLIPKKYLSSDTSGLVVEVKPGENPPLVFDLTDP